MNSKFLAIIAFFISLNCLGQINSGDSSVQVISYWGRGQMQYYTVKLERFKINDHDTILRETITYDVEITVNDINYKRYTISWICNNFTTNTEDKLSKKITQSNNGLTIMYDINELGEFAEVVNWKEIKDFKKDTYNKLRRDTKDSPELVKQLKKNDALNTNKKAFKTKSIHDIHQYHEFHGGKFKLGTIAESTKKIHDFSRKGEINIKNFIELYEINAKYNNYVLMAYQELDKKQLPEKVSSNYKKFTKNIKTKNSIVDPYENVSYESNNITRLSDTGWIIYSNQVKKIIEGQLITIEKRTIELVN